MPVYSSVRHRLIDTPTNLGKKLDFSSTNFTLLKTEYYRQEYTKREKKKKSKLLHLQWKNSEIPPSIT